MKFDHTNLDNFINNLKAVTRNELYGYLHPTTREWKEGLISVTYRDMANNKTNKHQWIVLDGDIDAEWIEVCDSSTGDVSQAFITPSFPCSMKDWLCSIHVHTISGTKWNDHHQQ